VLETEDLPMTFDVYSSCPCGSGKKLKFCCHEIAGEMEKIQKLHEADQSRQAMQLLDKLGKAHPENPWVATTRGLACLDEGLHAEAKEILHGAFQAHPQNDLVLALYALASLAQDGYDAARPVVHRAFQRCSLSFPDLVSGIALSVAQYMLVTRRYMSARQHLALALRLSSEKGRQDAFVRLLQFDGDRAIPYPLRSVHHLAEIPGNGEVKKEAAKGAALGSIGCWGPAARLLGRLTEQEPESAPLWQNLGLCRAWDGDEAGAAEALHRAARLHSDFEAAVECETLAQILDLMQTPDRVETIAAEYRVKSASRLLTLLDNENRIPRQGISAEEFQEVLGLDVRPAGLFQVVDRSVDGQTVDKSTRPDDLPNVLAQLVVFDADSERGIDARAVLTRFDSAETVEAQELFESLAQDEAERIADGDEEYAQEGQWTPREFQPLQRRWHLPEQTPWGVRRALERSRWETFVTQTWPQTSLAGLGGKTPDAAAGDPELKVPLTSALYVLDAFSAEHEQPLDFAAMCTRLKLEPPRPIEVDPSTPLNSFSPMQLQRLTLPALNDAQLGAVLNRALLIHHPVFLYDVLKETLGRPACAEKVNLPRVYGTLAELCRNRGLHEEAVSWVQKGRDLTDVLDKEQQFEARLEWTMRELSLRLEEPEDPGLAPLLKHIWEYYVPKLPRLASHLTELLATFGLRPPAEAGVTADVGFGSTTEGGVWTPEARPSADAGKKLWLPGQE